MKLSYQSGKHMRIVQVVIIILPIEISGHGRDEVIPMLNFERFTKLNSGNLCNGVRFVCLFKISGKYIFLLNRLRCIFRVNARRSQKKQFFNLVFMCSTNYIEFDGQVIIYKICPVYIVSINTAHFSCCKKNIFGLFLSKEIFYLLLVSQVKL